MFDVKEHYEERVCAKITEPPRIFSSTAARKKNFYIPELCTFPMWHTPKTTIYIYLVNASPAALTSFYLVPVLIMSTLFIYLFKT